MNADILPALIVFTFGLFVGTGIGLLLGFLLRQQKRDWQEMTRRQVIVNAVLIITCSAIAIAGLAYYAFFM